MDQRVSQVPKGRKRALRSREPLPAGLRRAYERYLRMALKLPGAEASTSYGTPAVKIRGKLLSRWRTEAEGALAIRCDFLDRQILLQARPDVFFLTDHYRDYPMVLLQLEKASTDLLRDTLDRAWQLVASAKMLKKHGQAEES